MLDFVHDAFWFMVGFVAAFWPVYLIVGAIWLLTFIGNWDEKQN